MTKVFIGQINEMVPHPDSDHLNICQVNIGDKKVQIVAGAPNAALGLKTIVALPGAMMPMVPLFLENFVVKIVMV